MSQTISQLQTEGLEIKLTDEKLFITTSTSTETFALRSIDGIGVIDLIDKLNEEMTEYKKARLGFINLLLMGSIILIGGLYIMTIDISTGFGTLLFGGAMGGFGFYSMNNKPKPTLKSAVRIMMTGGNRDFTFDKAHANSSDVAEFVAKVEDTLTAFHKK
jgi:hypothetical protein